MESGHHYLSELRLGQKGIIESFTDYELSLKLLEMGCIPGEIIEVIRIAPFGDPIAISISGYILSLRKDEAATVRIKSLPSENNKQHTTNNKRSH